MVENLPLQIGLFFFFPDSRAGARCINVYDSKDLSKLIANVELDPSPATLMLFYDEDSATVFATGKVNFPLVQPISY